MQFSGEEQFTQPREEIFRRVTDLTFMSKTVPGLQKIEKSQPRLLECKVNPGFSFVTGSVKLTFELLEETPSSSATMRVTGKGIGMSVAIDTNITLSDNDSGGTRLVWNSEVSQMTGLAKVISPSLVEAAAKKINAQTWDSFRKELAKV
jgi:carbon monoxide dehydrogenase subunit G